jgi:hypothetical protein
MLLLMLPLLPPVLGPAFMLTTALAVGLYYYAVPRPGRSLLAWLLVQAALGLSGFYTNTTSWPPHLGLLLVPPLALLAGLLGTGRGRRYLAGLRLEALTLLHVVRLPVELVLLALYRHGAVPQSMTFEGRNWDIVMGLSAPVVYYLVRTKRLGRTSLLVWNVLGVVLLCNIVVMAILSAPSPLQRFAFAQPNVAILYFPYVWLPSVVVPLVLLAHVAALRQLLAARSVAPLSA